MDNIKYNIFIDNELMKFNINGASFDIDTKYMESISINNNTIDIVWYNDPKIIEVINGYHDVLSRPDGHIIIEKNKVSVENYFGK